MMDASGAPRLSWTIGRPAVATLAATAAVIALLVVGSAACFQPRARDCAVRCGAGDVCPDGARCSNGRCTSAAECEAPPPPPVCGSCAPRDAAPRCQGNVALACAGGAWSVQAVCVGEIPYCVDGGCRQCLPDTDRCRDGCRQACRDGLWITSETCETCSRQPTEGPGLAAGWSHTCAALGAANAGGHRVACWGDNEHGQLGVGHARRLGDDVTDFEGPTAVVDLGAGRTALELVAGGRHTCARLDTGQVKCWGANGRGQLGLGDTRNRGGAAGELGDALPTVDLGQGRSATALTAGGQHTCAVLDTGQVKCWGANSEGQLGLGDTEDRGDGGCEMGDDLKSVDLGGARATAVAAGLAHTCALLDTGAVACWGANGRGQLGLGHDDDTQLPATVTFKAEGTVITALALGSAFTCALERSGAMICWGADNAGQVAAHADLLMHTSPELLSAIDVPGVVTAIASGASHTCALLQAGTLKCWGLNMFGQLGLADTTNRGRLASEPVEQLPIDLGAIGGRPLAATAVATGGDHTCARLEDGGVKCWGLNHAGQLGQGDTRVRGDDPGELGDTLRVVPLTR